MIEEIRNLVCALRAIANASLWSTIARLRRSWIKRVSRQRLNRRDAEKADLTLTPLSMPGLKHSMAA